MKIFHKSLEEYKKEPEIREDKPYYNPMNILRQGIIIDDSKDFDRAINLVSSIQGSIDFQKFSNGTAMFVTPESLEAVEAASISYNNPIQD